MTEVLMMIQPLPSLRVLEVGCGQGAVTEPLSRHLLDSGGIIDLIEYAPEELGILEQLGNVSLTVLDDYDHPINVPAREYEAVVITDLMARIADPERLLRSCFHSLENSGNLLILCHDGVEDQAALEALLDATQYVAVNRIDMQSPRYLLTAKKMHNWGHGL